jgi:hypothetical protein
VPLAPIQKLTFDVLKDIEHSPPVCYYTDV